MEEPYNKTDEFTRKLVQDAGLKTPSFDFTALVMKEVETKKLNDEVFVYKPLISKKFWGVFLGALISLLMVFRYGKIPVVTSSIIKASLGDYKTSIPQFEFSEITVYSVIVFGVLFAIQATFLKKNLDKLYSL